MRSRLGKYMPDARCLAAPHTSSMGWNFGQYGGVQTMSHSFSRKAFSTFESRTSGLLALSHPVVAAASSPEEGSAGKRA